MIQKVIFLLLLSSLLDAQSDEERVYKDKMHLPKGFGIHTDIGYSSYLIELHSSEMDSAIDYDVTELTLGASYGYGKWLWGVYGKFLLNELNSNMYVVTTQSPLGDQSNIDKDEFALYVNYRLQARESHVWKVNVIYRYASLNAVDGYFSFYNYGTHFKYTTNGVALSLLYSHKLTEKSSYFAMSGVVCSQAKVNMSEYIDANPQDSFVYDYSNALGAKFSVGYNYQLSNHLFLNLRADAWQHNFDKLTVTSRVGDTLPRATLKEQSFTTYGGITWRF